MSAAAMKEITPLGSDLHSSNSLTALEVSAATAADVTLQAQIAEKTVK